MSTRKTLIVVAAGVVAAALIGSFFFDPRWALGLAGALALIATGCYAAYRWVSDNNMTVRMGDTEVVIRIVNSPFGKTATKEFLTGAADYIMRGLKHKVLPQLADYNGPQVPLTSPAPARDVASATAEIAPVDRPQAPVEATPPVAPKVAPSPQEPAVPQATAEQPAATALAVKQVAPPAEDPDSWITRLQDDYASDEAENQALEEATTATVPDKCQICRKGELVGSFEVWDGEGLQQAYVCQSCAETLHEQQDAQGFPPLWKLNEENKFVPHNKPPRRIRTDDKSNGKRKEEPANT